MESDTSSPAGLEQRGPFNPSTSDYFGTTFHSVGETGAVQQCAARNDAVSGDDFSLEHHHPLQSAAAMALFPYPEPSGPQAVAASTAMMSAQPVLDWQGGLSLYNTALFSPSIEQQPDYYGAWASGAQPMAGLGLTSPHGVEEQSQQPQPQLQLQAQHEAWVQTMTPPDDSFPVAHETGRPQIPVSLHLVPEFARLPASNGVSSGGPSMPVGSGGASAEMAGFQYSSAGVGDHSQLSPVTPIAFIESPSAFILSPQPGTPGRRHRRPPISVSSPASLSTVSASTKTARASSASSHDDSVCPESPKKSRHGSMSHPRGRSSNVGRESNINGGKRPASTDDDHQGSGATAATVAGKSSSRARGSNREAAKKCREKTRLNEQHLEDRERAVKARNNRLRRELDSVKEEVQMWRSHLLMHGGCDNSSINNWIRNRAAEISEKILSPVPASQVSGQTTAAVRSRLQPLTPMPINGRLNFRLQPPPPPLMRRPAR